MDEGKEISFYTESRLDDLMEDDEISAEERGFMQGYNEEDEEEGEV